MRSANGAAQPKDKAPAPAIPIETPDAKPAKRSKVAAGTPPAPPPSSGVVLVNMAFGEIRHVVSRLLRARANGKERAAAEYWGASICLQLAEVWRTAAKKQAIAVGVLPNYEAKPYAIGTAETVYHDAFVSIGLKVVAQADRLDAAGFVADLQKAGVEPKLLARLQKKHTTIYAGAHIFTASQV